MAQSKERKTIQQHFLTPADDENTKKELMTRHDVRMMETGIARDAGQGSRE